MVGLSVCNPMLYFQPCVALVALQILVGLIDSSLHKVFSEFLLLPLDILCCCRVIPQISISSQIMNCWQRLSIGNGSCPLNGSFQTKENVQNLKIKS